MDVPLFFGGSVIAAVVAGMIALFAPCCISVMLPAYFASSFHNRRLLTAMTFVFAAGVATVIMPIALGATALRQLLVAEHTPIYLVAGATMLGLAGYVLLGGRIALPMPGRRASARSGPWGVYTLGVFSGVASSCCAPVLAGVIALAGVASSFAVSLGLGAAYVFGMVAPLFVIALAWERRDWSTSRLFHPRGVTYRIGPLRRTISGTSAASGALLAVMGLATVGTGLWGEPMPAPSGWQLTAAVRLQRVGAAVVGALDWIPLWAGATLVVAIVVWLARRALTQTAVPPTDSLETTTPPLLEEAHEQQHA